MQRRHHPLQRVIEQDGRHPRFHQLLLCLVLVRGAKEGLVLLHRLALVVVNLAPRPHPARHRVGPILRFRLNLGLEFPPKPIGIEETHLYLLGLKGFSLQITDMDLPRQGRRIDRLARSLIPLQAINNPGCGCAQSGYPLSLRISQEVIQLPLSQIRCKRLKGISLGFGIGCFAHHRSPRHHPQGVKGHLGAIAIGIGQLLRLHYPVIVLDGDDILQRVYRSGH